MFIDEVDNIVFTAGHGGPGRVSFRRPPEKGPDGGNGGKGGNLYLQAITDPFALAHFAAVKKFTAGNGEAGDRNRRSGKDGQDLYVSLPIGTHLVDQKTGQTLVEITPASSKVLLCQGGLGGRGNFEFRSSTNTTPKFAQPGLAGESQTVRLILKLLADYGLIGLPNTGKSSLLNALTGAKAKVAAYPFTTLEPNLGALGKKIIADIPGLIEGASTGKGLGIQFLKHIEKVSLLLHCLLAESEDILRDYHLVRKELASYHTALTNKSEIILLTKIDLIDQSEVVAKAKILKHLKRKIIPVSVHQPASLDLLRAALD